MSAACKAPKEVENKKAKFFPLTLILPLSPSPVGPNCAYLPLSYILGAWAATLLQQTPPREPVSMQCNGIVLNAVG